ncbi:ATP-binding cassette glutathione S-conjugate transporter ycf1 [Maudiozyma exigua]|uniref:ATP-binding cassette glutathione S-conjugate transporter ycf1 n=1 Tax=Maudiozyma exigua TaxID=34358 RepID=A0A9P6W6J7_MAUEX|nr:ATP-binding cassette glutathione S-conjugate transporter ycf1 [Kazachstania exigua]
MSVEASPSWACRICQSSEGFGPISRYGDFTQCFIDGVILNLTALYMIVFGTRDIARLVTSKHSGIKYRRHWLIVSRMTLVLLQILFTAIVSLSLTTEKHKDYTVVSQYTLTLISLFVSLSLHWVEYHKQRVSNTIILFYWLFESFGNINKVINFLIRYNYENRWTFGHTVFVFTLFQAITDVAILALEIFPTKPLRPYQEIQEHLSRRKVNPYDTANIFSRISFTWMSGLMKTGYKKYLVEEDLFKLPESFGSEELANKLDKNWENQLKKTDKPSLTWTLCLTFGWNMLIAALFKVMHDILAFTQPQLLRLLIKFVSDYNGNMHGKYTFPTPKLPIVKGFMISISMFFVGFVQTCVLHQYFLNSFNTGMNIKSSLTAVLYKKSLVLSNEAQSTSSTGDIVNLMSVDVQKLQDLTQWCHLIWSGPLQIVFCLASLYNLLGNSMWVGVIILVVMMPANSYIMKYQKKLQKSQMKFKDERTRVISEILNNIKSLKLYAWEGPYKKKLEHVRNDKELKNLTKLGCFMALSSFQFNVVPFLVSCCTFAVFVYTEKRPLTTDLVFPALTLFNLLSFPLMVVPNVLTGFIEVSVSIGRLYSFLTNEELQKDAVQHLPKVTNKGDVAVNIGDDATFLWKRKPEYRVALKNINFQAKKGELSCIVGKVGSGKTALIQSILGNLFRIKGFATVHGSVAYVSQVPWIMNGTVKDNILFGHKYDKEFYEKTIKACALTIDLAILMDGDQTLVGEKGISLSGGQKARLSLARAVYARADTYIMDDPLAAVDEHVAKHLIEHVLGPNGLLHTKTKVLSTNKISVLSIADSITLLENGEIIQQGTYGEVTKDENSPLCKLISEFGSKKDRKKKGSNVDDESAIETPSTAVSVREDTVPLANELEELDKLQDMHLVTDETSSLRRASNATLRSIDFGDEENASRREHREQGKVKWNIYLEYAKACNPKNVVIFILFIVLSMFLSVMGNVWLKHWSEINTRYGANPNAVRYLVIYFALGVGSALSTLIQTIILWVFCTIHGSKYLHNVMTNAVLRAPMVFFETTPIGRILNRFSNDIYKVDSILGRSFSQFFVNAVKVIFVVVVICFTTWQFVFIIVPLGVLYVYYQQYYLRTSRELRRLDSITRSPIYSHFQETLGGITTIRGYHQEKRFRHINQCRIDNNMSAFYPSINANRWLAFRLETIGSVIILGAGTLSILRLKQGTLTEGMVGLSLSYALQITQTLNWIVRMTVEVETNIVSVERIKEYADLKSEAPEIIKGHRPSQGWPIEGNIQFDNYSTRYRSDLDLVLKDINLNIHSKEKIGIVGRTGAGKSSLTLALFRIIEASAGRITIDNIAIDTIGLYDLRHHLSIIPQDSQVFEGTIRENIDPTESYTDEEIWHVLELSHLKDHVLQMGTDGLLTKLSEGGSNMSVGQRQLMCLARALLVQSKVLILDEATAAVDVETDQVIQQTIRTAFKDRTILTIAHRLNTIMDSDRIIVLDQGEVKEFDSPANLLQNPDSLFYSLCEEAGLANTTTTTTTPSAITKV